MSAWTYLTTLRRGQPSLSLSESNSLCIRCKADSVHKQTAKLLNCADVFRVACIQGSTKKKIDYETSVLCVRREACMSNAILIRALSLRSVSLVESKCERVRIQHSSQSPTLGASRRELHPSTSYGAQLDLCRSILTLAPTGFEVPLDENGTDRLLRE